MPRAAWALPEYPTVETCKTNIKIPLNYLWINHVHVEVCMSIVKQQKKQQNKDQKIYVSILCVISNEEDEKTVIKMRYQDDEEWDWSGKKARISHGTGVGLDNL